jgi:hypothetical protein
LAALSNESETFSLNLSAESDFAQTFGFFPWLRQSPLDALWQRLAMGPLVSLGADVNLPLTTPAPFRFIVRVHQAVADLAAQTWSR